MYDRPTMTELIEAAVLHFEDNVVPVAREENRKVYFQTLVAINVLRIVARENALRPYHLRAEWTRLNMVMGRDYQDIERDDDLEVAIQGLNRELCQRIRDGEFDEDYVLFEHLIAHTTEQLEVANPKFLQAIKREELARQHPENDD